MSEPIRELKGITATFQAVLNTQIIKVMVSIDAGNTFQAYTSLQTLIDALNPVHTKELRQDIVRIDKRINAALRLEGVDLCQTRRIRKSTAETVTKQETRTLFRKVMNVLHDKGYLEHIRVVRHGRYGV